MKITVLLIGANGILGAHLIRELPRWPIPPGLARLYGIGCDAFTKLTRRPGRLNSAMIAVANDGYYFSSQKAITKLGLPQTPIEEAIDEAFNWFTQHNYLTQRARTN